VSLKKQIKKRIIRETKAKHIKFIQYYYLANVSIPMLTEHGLKYHSFEVHHLLEYDAMKCGRNLPTLRSFPKGGQVFCSETSVNFCHTVSQDIQDDSTLHSHRHDKFKLVKPFPHRQFGYTAGDFVTSELHRWTA
jgi:hypothetical protein